MRSSLFPSKLLYDLGLLALLLALFFSVGLGDRPYSAPSESRYIEIGREMAESGDFVTPRLNYVKYFEKPPLFYWVQALSTRAFGYDPFDARIPTAIFAVLLCLVTYALGRFLYGRLAGWLSALTLGTSLYLFALSRVVLVDVPVSVFLCATLAAFLYVAQVPPSFRRTLVTYAMYAAAAGAVLTKGLIGAVIPGAVIFLWLACTGRWSLLKDMRIVSGTVLFLLIAVPWHVLVAARNPEWAWFYFIHEHVLRYVTPEAGRNQPIWFFLAVSIAGFFPWIVFMSQAKLAAFPGFWRKRHEDGTALYLLLWAGFIFVFFSLSHSKLIPYVLPIFPPLTVVLGRYLAAAWEEKPAPGFNAGFWALIVLLLIFATLPSMLLAVMDKESKVAEALAQGGDDLHYLSIASVILAGFLVLTYVQGRRRHVIIGMLLASTVFLQLGDRVASHYDKDSMKLLAGIIRDLRKPGDEVAMYEVYYQDMPVYIGGRVTLVGWENGELSFGAKHEDDSQWMMTADSFWKRWMQDDHRMFLVMRQDAYERLTKNSSAEKLHLFYMENNGRNLLFMNRAPELAGGSPQKEPKKP